MQRSDPRFLFVVHSDKLIMMRFLAVPLLLLSTQVWGQIEHQGEHPIEQQVSLPFPEEKNPSTWDWGCEQWPLELAFHMGLAGRMNPALRIQKDKGALSFLAGVFFQAEKGESPQKVLETVQAHAVNGESYHRWIMPDINSKPGGSRYFVDVNALRAEKNPMLNHWMLTGPFTFQLLWLKKEGVSTLSFRGEKQAQVPNCPAFAHLKSEQRRALRILYRMTPREDLLHMLMAEAWFLPHPAGAEMRFRLVAIPHPLVYQVMPEALFRYELEARARRLFQNFIDFRRLGYVPVASKSSSSNE